MRANRVALNDRLGSTTLYWFAGLRSGNCFMSSQLRQDVRGVEYRTTTLDECAAELDVQLIKCDVGGVECLMLGGAKRLLARRMKPICLTEITPQVATDFGYAPGYTLEALETAGYRFLSFDGDSLGRLSRRTLVERGSTNLIALVPDLHKNRLVSLGIRS